MESIAASVRTNFARQDFMDTVGAKLTEVDDGRVVIEFAPRPGILQQHGYVHAGVVSSVLDSACGYAALTKMTPGSEVLSVEFKTNLLAPAAGEKIVVEGRVLRAGRLITVCRADAHAHDGDRITLIATMLGTMIRRGPGGAPAS
ncbi:MAG: PaaI family thioesterase [Gammaproteobacteria bacterium]